MAVQNGNANGSSTCEVDLLDLDNEEFWNEISDLMKNSEIDQEKMQYWANHHIEVTALTTTILSRAAANLMDVDKRIYFLVKCFRCLRFGFSIAKEYQDELMAAPTFLDDSLKIMIHLVSLPETEVRTLCAQIGLQYLGNLVVGNPENQRLVYSKCHTLVRTSLMHPDSKIQDHALMIVYNICIGMNNRIDLVEDEEFVFRLTQLSPTSDYAYYMLIVYARRGFDVDRIYYKLNTTQRIVLLDAIYTLVTRPFFQHDGAVCSPSVRRMPQYFKLQSDSLLQRISNFAGKFNSDEMIRLLNILCVVAYDSPLSKQLRCDKALLVTCIHLLKEIHEAGKTGSTTFKTLDKLSDFEETKNSLLPIPFFEFKSTLIRLIGNLCWGNKHFQDEVREQGVFPVLLDCCKPDAKNPAIVQNCVFAFFILCKNNRANQAIIAGIPQRGELDAKSLKEMGITIHADRKTVEVKPPDEQRNLPTTYFRKNEICQSHITIKRS